MAVWQMNRALKVLMSEHGMTAADVADRVNSAEELLFGAPGNATDRQVRRWLSGESAAPRLHYVAALMHVFSVSPELLGFALPPERVRRLSQMLTRTSLSVENSSSPGESTPVLRREFVFAASGNLLAFAPLPSAGRIGMSDIVRMRTSIDQLLALDDAHGGQQLAAVAELYVQRIESAMRDCVYGPNVERGLYQVMGELRASAGWFAFDSGDHERAGRNFDAGLRGALLAGDRALQARIWSYMSRQSWELGRGTETVTMARAALDATRNGRDPRLGALLHGRLALGFAALGEQGRCGAALARAEMCLDRADTAEVPAWLAFVGPGELLGAAAMAHMNLHCPEQAVAHEEEGMNLLEPKFRRNRFAKLVHLSECHLAANSAEQAVGTANQALDLYTDVTCPRWERRLGRFRDTLVQTGLPPAQDFVERYDVIITAT